MDFNNIKLLFLKKRIKYSIVLVIISFIASLAYLLSVKQEKDESSLVQSLDLQHHPIYSHYDYTQNDSIINIGIPPFYLPTGIIFEVIKWDKILQQELKLLGKRIAYFPYLKGADINFFLKQKELDGGVGGDMPALSASSNFDIIIPVLLQKGNVSIVSSKPMLTNDLEGKRIGYPIGSISHYFLLDLLHNSEIDKTETTLIPMDVTSMPNALHNNEIDLFSAWEPIVASSLKQYPEFFMTFRRISTGYLYFSKEFAAKNPEAVNHILAAVIRAIAWMKSERENLLLACKWNIVEMEKLNGGINLLNADEIADLALNDILRYDSKYSIVLAEDDLKINSMLHKEFRFLKELNKIHGSSKWEEVRKSFDRNLIVEIYKQPREYKLNEFDYKFNEIDLKKYNKILSNKNGVGDER